LTELSAEKILGVLRESGIKLIVSLPDSWFADLEQRVSQDTEFRHISVANEADGVAICGGAWLGGAKSAMFMENSGLLSTYVLTRFHISFGVPFLLLVSYRGDIGDGNWWASSLGRVTEPVLRSLGISYIVVRSSAEIPGAIRNADRSAMASLLPSVVLFGTGSL
jgi:sulfopyruvate decarboxylase subunit alpha